MAFAVDTWFALRIDFISLGVNAVTSTFCIIYSSQAETKEERVFTMMLLTYMLLLQEFALWSVRYFTWIEKRMVSVDRCLKILEIP